MSRPALVREREQGPAGGSRQVADSLWRQWWLAALLMTASCGLSTFFNGPLFFLQPLTVLGLLPGLLAAGHLLLTLHASLQANHRPGEDGLLFPTLGAANWITVLRGCAVIGLAGFLPLALVRSGSTDGALAWTPGLIYLGVSVADLLDGLVARRQGQETELGKRLDIATDAAGLLVASLLAVAYGRLPIAYLLVGLAYYPFVIGGWLRQRRGRPLAVLQPRAYARIIAGFQMGLVVVALLPVFLTPFTFTAAFIFMTPLLAGFLRDWLVVSCRLQTDAGQRTAWDGRATILWGQVLPLVARVVVLGAGITALAGGGGFGGEPPWLFTYVVCCLLAGWGCLGRTAGLGLTLLLAVRHSPFVGSAGAMIAFSAAVILMLAGTGPWSLWTPEDAVLSRRWPQPGAGDEVFDLSDHGQ